MKAKTILFHAAAAGVLLLSGLSPLHAHSYSVCATQCFNAGGTVQACANYCQNHKHGGGGIRKPELGFAAEDTSSLAKARSVAPRGKHQQRHH